MFGIIVSGAGEPSETAGEEIHGVLASGCRDQCSSTQLEDLGPVRTVWTVRREVKQAIKCIPKDMREANARG